MYEQQPKKQKTSHDNDNDETISFLSMPPTPESQIIQTLEQAGDTQPYTPASPGEMMRRVDVGQLVANDDAVPTSDDDDDEEPTPVQQEQQQEPQQIQQGTKRKLDFSESYGTYDAYKSYLKMMWGPLCKRK